MTDDVEIGRVNQQVIAAYFKVTTRTISNWQRRKNDPLPVVSIGNVGEGHQFEVHDCIRWYVRQQMVKNGSTGEILDFNAERARLTKEQADGHTLKNDVLRGNLLEAETVAELWAKHILAAQSQLRAIVSKLRTRMPELKPRQVEAIGNLIDRAMNELSRTAYPEPEETAEAESEAASG